MAEIVGLVAVSHSRPLARAAVGLAREMAQDAPVRIAVAAGLDDAGPAGEVGLGTDAVAIAEAIGEVSGPAGVVVLMDLGSAVLSAELALDLLDPDVAERVTLSPAPLVEGLVAAVVAAAGGAPRAEVAAEAAAGLIAKTEHLGAPVAAGPPPAASPSAPEGSGSRPAPGDAGSPPAAEGAGLSAPGDVGSPLVSGGAGPPSVSEGAGLLVSGDVGSPLVSGGAGPSSVPGGAGHGSAPEGAGPGPVSGGADAPSTVGGLRGSFVVTDPQGLHARPAAALIGAVRGTGVPVTLRNLTTGAGPVPAESLSRVATLEALSGHEVEVGVPAGAEDALRRVLSAAHEIFGAPPGPRWAPPESALPPAAGSPAVGLPVAGTPAVGSSAAGSPAAGSPAGVSPAAGPSAAVPSSAEPSAAEPFAAGMPAAVPAGQGPSESGETVALLAGAGALAASPGIVIGVVRQRALRPAAGDPVAAARSPEHEQQRLEGALAAVAAEITTVRERVAAELGAAEAGIFDAHLLLLDDPELRTAASARITSGADAGTAWAEAIGAAEATWSALANPYLRARAADLAALRDQVMAALTSAATTRPAPTAATPAPTTPGEVVRPEVASSAATPAPTTPGEVVRADVATAATTAGFDSTGEVAPADDSAASDAAPADAASGMGLVSSAGRDASADASVVLIVEDLTPVEAVAVDPARIAGVVLAHGSPTAHSVLLLRARGIPAVVAAGDTVLAVPDGTPVALDGDTGELVLDPAPDVRERLERTRADAVRTASAAAAQAHRPARTRDGVQIEVGANLGGLADATAAAAAGADLAGLVRTEFLFLDRDAAPDVDEQVTAYRALADALGGRRLTLRTLDVGGDKPLPYAPVPPGDNPFLGVRGLRFSLLRPDLFAAQLTAIVRVAHETPVSVLFPMVSTVDELRAAREALDDAVRGIGRGIPAGLRVGAMIEVPAAALKASALAPLVDVFSIGTNDLTQYTLAAARGDGGVASLGDPWDPAVLRLVDVVCRAAGERVTVSVCGEFASAPGAASVLVGLGARELSVVPAQVPGVKQAVRETSVADAATLVADLLTRPGAAEARAAATVRSM